MIDQNSNGISDVWEWVNNAPAINPNADPDGDGFSNLQEATAGTNPFDAKSYPKIAGAVYTNASFNVSIPGVPGKRYELQSVQYLGSTNWINETSLVARAASPVTIAAPADQKTKYFRIALSDTNTDGGTLNDWEKYQLGLDPFNPYSNGQRDINGNALTDYQYVTNQLAQQNIVTLSATDPVTIQPDPGQAATDLGVFTVTRSGFPLNAISVSLVPGGSGAGIATPGLDYNPLPVTIIFPAGVSSQTVNVTPLANTNLMTPVVAPLKIIAGAGYTLGSPTNSGVVIYPSTTPGGKGLYGEYFTNSSTTYTNFRNFNPTNLFLTRIDPVIDFTWTNGTSPNLSNGLYTVRWTGQVQPQYSETYFFDVKSDDGSRLWVNDQLLIDKWQSGSSEWTNAINLQGGACYNIRLEYLQTGGAGQAHLYWYSPNQSKQVIPSSRLYSTNSSGGNSNAPSVVTSALNAVAFLGQPFSFTVTAANSPLGFTANGLPPGLSFNNTNGAIAGIPTLAGDYQVTLTASNLIGIGASIVDIVVLNTGSSIVREIWTNISGSSVTDIPTGAPANLINNLGSLEGITDYGDNYGERIRGFLTAPTSGNYYFWIAGGDSAQLWISDDNEPVNKVLRAWVTPTNNPTAPGHLGTSARQWNLQANQRSGWLALTAGKQYYVEILHKASTGTGDNWSVAWLLDPTGTNTTPAGVVPGYVASRYYPPLPVSIPGTLYSANLLALPGVASTGVGSATLRLSADQTQAILKYQINNLVGTPTGRAINADPYLNNPAQLVYDISAARPQADGSYVWKIKPTGTLSAADIVEIINEGKAAINIESSTFPGGEINGHFTLADGTQNFTPPPAPPSWTDDHADTNAAVRFLNQATFGASSSDLAAVTSIGYDAWINNQFALPATHHLPLVLTNASSDPAFPYPSTLWFNTWWQQSVTAPDQLRQRVAFALSEIMVVSENNGTLQNNARGLAYYYDTLLDNSFGNFRTLLEAVTLTPAMGVYLNMQGNDKGNIITGLHANENYAREINQLFSIGLNRLWPDGSLILNSQGTLVPTYDQNVIMGFAAALTGWNYYQANQTNGHLPSNWFPSGNFTNPMVLVPTHHDLNSKLLLNNVVLPPAWGDQTASTNTAFDNYCLQDLELALDSINNNQNVGPFICRQLIQRLVTSNPSRDYVYRVVAKFNDNGSGVRGDLSAVVKAILLDYEARSTNLLSQPAYGKQREPVLRVTAPARAFLAPPSVSGTYVENGSATVTNTTSVPHRLNNNDTVFLTFTDTSGNPAPQAKGYSVTVNSPTTFRVTLPGLVTGTYGQTNYLLTLTASGHGLTNGHPVYLAFTSGNSTNGVYQVSSVPDSSHFTVATLDPATNSGNFLFPRLTGGGFVVKNNTNATVYTSQEHGLNVGDKVQLDFSFAGSPTNGQYAVVSVPDATHFTVVGTNVNNQSQDGLTVYPLVAPRLAGHGNVSVQWNTWNLGYTDSGISSSLSQSPLRAPTVFNFYFPDYQFPGVLASAGLTTPEFQLTSDTSVALQMNFIGGGILNNGSNTNGLSSFTGGDGDIVLDIGPWMTTNYTAAAGIPQLVDALNSRLLAGQLSAGAKNTIINYVTNTANFQFSTPPTATEIRDRVRGVIHLILSSPDYTIQK